MHIKLLSELMRTFPIILKVALCISTCQLRVKLVKGDGSGSRAAEAASLRRGEQEALKCSLLSRRKTSNNYYMRLLALAFDVGRYVTYLRPPQFAEESGAV